MANGPIYGSLPPEARLFFETKDDNAEDVKMSQNILTGITGGIDKETGFINLPLSNIFGTPRRVGTPVEGTVTDAPITAEEEDLFKRGFAAIQDQQTMGATTTTPLMGSMPPSPTMGATPPSPSVRGVGELIGFRPDVPGQTLTQFMQQGVDPQGRLIGAGTDAFAQASREREARLAQEEAGRRMQEARSRGEIGGGLGDYMSLARQAGATGGAVKTMADQLRTQAEQQAATTQAELETEAKKQDTYQARIDALQEEKPDESTAAIGRIDNLISRGILPADKRNEAILSELGLDPNELLPLGIELSEEQAQDFLDKAGGDREEARRLAREAGYTFS
jgi:hypothetical protein